MSERLSGVREFTCYGQSLSEESDKFGMFHIVEIDPRDCDATYYESIAAMYYCYDCPNHGPQPMLLTNPAHIINFQDTKPEIPYSEIDGSFSEEVNLDDLTQEPLYISNVIASKSSNPAHNPPQQY